MERITLVNLIYEAVFLGYSLNSKSYRVFNRRTLHAEEFVHVTFDEFLDLEENPLESNTKIHRYRRRTGCNGKKINHRRKVWRTYEEFYKILPSMNKKLLKIYLENGEHREESH